MYKEGKVYVPKNNKLRTEIIRLHYDMLVEGYGEQQKTVELVTCNFWQPGVTKEMKQYVKGYDAYQQNKNHTEQPAGKLMPNSIPEKPWTHILVDFIAFGLEVQLNFSSSQQVNKNSTFYSYHRKDFSRGVSTVVQR